MVEQETSQLLLIGAGCFGALIGWIVYYINRYRQGAPKANDLVTIIGVIGGAAILKLFPAGTDIFGAYGIGLAVGFFTYFVVLLILVKISRFPYAWFLDGRRRKLDDNEEKSPYEIQQFPMVK